MKTSNEVISDDISILEKEKTDLEQEIRVGQARLREIDDSLYRLKVRALHIGEIYRQAKKHLPRLQGNVDLSEADIKEIEKWIGRAKTEGGLTNIRDAISEMEKYYDKEVRKNVYALIQKIIIEGPKNAAGR